MLEGVNFMGRQLHERDGLLFYWGVNPREIEAPLEEFFDLAANALKNLSGDNFTRHTGPSVMFKYFYQNGFKLTVM